VVVDKGDLTVEEFVQVFPEVHHGVKVSLLCKAGISADDLKSGKVSPFYTNAPPRVPTMALNMLKNPNLSANLKAKFEKEVAEAEAYNKAREARLKTKLYDAYVAQFGAPVAPDRNFLLLTGDFAADDCDFAEVPLIKYVFKH
jgi:hypothetical protein